jgi:hypothetical protein
MKFLPILLIGMSILLSACKSSPTVNYQQIYEQSLADGQVTMMTLHALDTGDIRKTRQVAITSLHVTLSWLPELAFQAKPTEEQKREEIVLAQDVLDYMLQHKDEFDPRLPSVRVGVRGLQKILIEPDDVRRCKELSDYLAVKQKMLEANKP